jgi:prophage antirepressor-like protein
MVGNKLRVVTDDAGRRWVQAADVPEIRKLGLESLRKLCPEVEHFDDGGRPVRWLPVDRMAVLLSGRGVEQGEAEAREAMYGAAPLAGVGLRRHGLPKLPVQPESPVEEPVATLAPVVAPTANPPPLVMNGAGATVTFEGHEIPVHVFRDRACVIAGDLGRALGYVDGRLAESVREWPEMTEPQDFAVLRGDDLRAFKALPDATPTVGVGRASHLMVLYETGMDLACQKAQTEAGARLRRYLADEVLPKLRRGEPVAPVVAQAPSSPALAADPRLDRLLDVVEAQSRETRTLIGLVGVLVARLAPAALPAAPAPVAAAPSPAPAPSPATPAPRPRSSSPTRGRSTPALVADHFYSPSDLAALLSAKFQRIVSKEAVGKAITARGLRGREDLYEIDTRTVNGGDKIVAVTRWRGSIWGALVEHFEKHGVGGSPVQQTLPDVH